MTAEPTIYAEEYIGDCATGTCDRPATVREYQGFALCALHHHRYEVGEEINEVNLALDLLEPWCAQAEHHSNDHLLRVLERAREDLREREAELGRSAREIERIDYESIHPHDLRYTAGRVSGPARKEMLAGLSGFGSALVDLADYGGHDPEELARELVSKAGERYGESEVRALVARMLSDEADPDSLEPPFMRDLAVGLGLTDREKMVLAKAYAFASSGRRLL